MAERKFIRAERGKYSMEEKEALGKLCKQYKNEFDAKSTELSKKVINYNDKMKKHTKPVPREGYIARAVRDFYPDLRNVKHDDPNLQAAVKLGKRCHEQLSNSESICEINVQPSSKYRKPGAGRKTTIPDVREALFSWFIDIRSTLKARLPRKMFKTQCRVFYEQWLAQQPEEIPVEKRIVFSNRWIKNWMKEYGVSLRHPNKRFQIKQADREERVFDYLKNIWTVRKFFLDNFGVDPPVINGDQMPLHRNESSSQKTLNFTGMDTYVKENYNLSRERVTVFTQVSSDPDLTLKPEFVFKGKGTRTSLHPPDGIKYNWAPKGSYRLEQMLYTISNLPNRYNIFTLKNYAIYVLDDYSVHIMPEIKEALLKRGYVPVIIGGGVTGDIQINDTDLHSKLKAKYRELEQLLMIDQLKSNPKKIPQPSRDDMMRMLAESLEAVDIDVVTRFKSLWVTNALDGSEDYLVSERIIMLVGEKLKAFRAKLNKNKSPKNLKDLLKLITPPKGVKRKGETTAVPVDEGGELFDCDGEELNHEPLQESDDSDQDDDQNNPLNEGQQSQTENQQTTTAAPVLLASVIKDNPELEKDATFLDNLGTLLSTSDTSDKFMPFMNSFKRNYIVARRAIKKRILSSNEKEVACEDNVDPSEGDDTDDFPNLFDNLFA